MVVAGLSGCSGGIPLGPLQKWFIKEKPTPSQSQGEWAVYYVSVDDLRLHDQPGGKSVARLPLYTKVLRSRLEKGYAYVRVGGLKGPGSN